MFAFCSKNAHPASFKRYYFISARTPFTFVRDISSSYVRMSKGPWSLLSPLTTLDPAHLKASDFRSPADKLKFIVQPTSMNDANKPMVTYKYSQGGYVPFPPEASGFFYFHVGPVHAPIAGSLRFRVVKSGIPKDFDDGYDLLSISRRFPWSIHLPSLANHGKYASLISLLLRDPPPVAPSLLDLLTKKQIPSMNMHSIILHSMGQPLYMDLDKSHVQYKIAEGYTLSMKYTPNLPRDSRGRDYGNGYSPYNGSIIFAFERAAGGGPPRCNVRVLEIVKPIRPIRVDYDGHIPVPVEGELLRGAGGHLWSMLATELYHLPDWSP